MTSSNYHVLVVPRFCPFVGVACVVCDFDQFDWDTLNFIEFYLNFRNFEYSSQIVV